MNLRTNKSYTLMSIQPFFTVVTATRDASLRLPRLLQSLEKQTCRDFELVIQDGVSRDATVAIAESYRDKLPFLSLASEPDAGIYDAWNKALPRVRGEWVLFLGADDALAGPQVLEAAREILQTFPDSTLFGAGDMVLVDDTGTVQRTIIADCEKAFEQRSRVFGMPLPHSALFTRQRVVTSNAFDASYKIIGDCDFLCRAWRTPDEAKSLHLLVARMALGGVSSNPATAKLMRAESRRCARKHFPLKWSNCYRYAYLMAESKFHDSKVCLKGFIQKCPLGHQLWKFLQACRKAMIDQGS